jgi:DNA-directed RNA polymerase sigma subunit (sigma70/sigma32)
LVHDALRRLWSGLDERERAVVTHRLMHDEAELTLTELGERFGLSRERLRQIEGRVKDRLKRTLETVH